MRKVRALLPVLFAGIQMTQWLPRVSAKPPSPWHVAGKEACRASLWVSLLKGTTGIEAVSKAIFMRQSALLLQRQLIMLFPRGTHPPRGRCLCTSRQGQHPWSTNCVQSTIIELKDEGRAGSPTSRAHSTDAGHATVLQPSRVHRRGLTL